jgi:multidrug efflux pump
MSRIFIDRPIFAWVIAIITMLLGLITLRSLPVEQYPDIAPPQVNIRANYPGASAETLENSVTQVIEQQLTGIDGLLYFSSSSTSRGRANVTVTFEKGTDPDIAQVQVQNRVQQAISRLPQQVQAQGLTVTKSNPDFLLVMGIYDTTNKSTNQDIADFLVSNLQDVLGRVEGVGETDVFGSQHAMRVWLDPVRLAGLGLIPGDVVNAITAQNAEVAAGEVGATPSQPGQMLNATVTAQSRLSTPEEFARIVVKTLPNGAIVQLRDVARVELGSENYGVIGRVNGHPAAGISISLSPGADALLTAERLKAEIAARKNSFPPGYEVAYPNDSTIFIKKSVEDVVKTLAEAVGLVVIVMFVFLQSWRATLIPAIAVPVVLLGTLVVFGLADFSINSLTLFGMVLAIGLLVDDAIVVVENVERLMAENPGMTPREATIQSMQEIQVALVAIALVLSAVFLPMAFFGGSTGVIYRQFSVTIIAAMVLSVFVALILSPALTATLLKRHEEEDHEGFVGRNSLRMRAWFDRNFSKLIEWHQAKVIHVVDHKRRYLVVYGLIVALLAALFLRLPTGFVPNEDQGLAMLQYNLPPGATLERTAQAARQIEDYFQKNEAHNLDSVQTVAGGGGSGGQNSGRGFLGLKDWADRPGTENSVTAITQRANKALSSLRDVEFYAVVPPSVRGLGQSTGFTAELMNSGGLSREAFRRVQDQVLAEARGNALLANVRLTSLPDQPTLKVTADAQKLAVLGLNQSDVNATMSTAWGGRYVNDFNDKGRVKRVYVQGDAPFRSAPEDLGQWQVRGSDGQMTPIAAFASVGWGNAPINLNRFNGVSNYEINGQPAPGTSSGTAMDAIAGIVARHAGVSLAWAGASYEERLSSGQAPYLYLLSLVVVFLCLAALYESWSIPLAVLLIIPLGLVGAVFAVTLRGLENDIYLQIGLLTTMGLAAKNAILMIEFAEQAERKGKRIIEAALDAARTRLRPILMTSCAFIFGVLPLALANGAGANSRIAIGTSVIGGMLTATILAVFYIPMFFVLVRRTTRDTLKRMHGEGVKPVPAHDDPETQA